MPCRRVSYRKKKSTKKSSKSSRPPRSCKKQLKSAAKCYKKYFKKKAKDCAPLYYGAGACDPYYGSYSSSCDPCDDYGLSSYGCPPYSGLYGYGSKCDPSSECANPDDEYGNLFKCANGQWIPKNFDHMKLCDENDPRASDDRFVCDYNTGKYKLKSNLNKFCKGTPEYYRAKYLYECANKRANSEYYWKDHIQKRLKKMDKVKDLLERQQAMMGDCNPFTDQIDQLEELTEKQLNRQGRACTKSLINKLHKILFEKAYNLFSADEKKEYKKPTKIDDKKTKISDIFDIKTAAQQKPVYDAVKIAQPTNAQGNVVQGKYNDIFDEIAEKIKEFDGDVILFKDAKRLC